MGERATDFYHAKNSKAGMIGSDSVLVQQPKENDKGSHEPVLNQLESLTVMSESNL